MGFNGDSGAPYPVVCQVGVESCVRTEKSPLCLGWVGMGRGGQCNDITGSTAL